MSRRDDAPDFQEIARRLREKQPERLKPARERRNPTRDWVTDHELRQDGRDSHGGNMDEWPSDLRIREFPRNWDRTLWRLP